MAGLNVVNATQYPTLRVVSGGSGANWSPQTTVSPYRTASPLPVTYNPQPAATSSVSYLQPTYSPQWAAAPTRYSPPLYSARIAQQQQQQQAQQAAAFAEANRRAQVERDRLAAEAIERKRRVVDAKKLEVADHSKRWRDRLLSAISFRKLRNQRAGRETAAKYGNENERVWGSQLESKQRNYENRMSDFKDWVMQSGDEAEFNRRAKTATDWLDREASSITNDIQDYNKTQKELSAYSKTPLSGWVPAAGRTFKNSVAAVGGAGFKALSYTASQPSRAVNTIKNFVNPNNLRMYYGGEEKKGLPAGKGSNPFNVALDQLRTSYAASKDQRIIGFSKEHEARIVQNRTRLIPVVNPDGSRSQKWVHYTPSGLDRFRGKFGDDIVDMLADPLTWLPGASGAKSEEVLAKFKGVVGDAVYKQLGKSDFLSKLIINRETKKVANPNRLFAWLKRAEGTKADSYFADNRKLIDYRDAASKTFSEHAAGWKSDKASVWQPVAAKLQSLTDRQARLLQEYVLPKVAANADLPTSTLKQAYSWQNVSLPRSFRRSERRELEDLARQLRRATDDAHVRRLSTLPEGSKEWHDAFKQYKKAYIPEKRTDPKLVGRIAMERPRQEVISTNANWFTKQKRDQGIQSAWRLRHSYKKRLLSQLYNESEHGQWLKLNADKYSKKLEDVNRVLDIRKQGYKQTKFDKANEFILKHRGKTPMGVWKKSVLKYNPAWYVNNVAWNIPASISATGGGAIPEMAKLLSSRKYRAATDALLPEGVTGTINKAVRAPLASKLEDFSRKSTFNALRKQGKSNKEALDITNRWLFDYTNKNYERPAKGIIPFIQWQKGLIKLSAKMPFTNPKSSKFYSEVYNKFFKRPYDALPNESQTYTDPQTGEETTYNPRQAYKGKAFLGKDKNGNQRFANAPWFAVNPDNIMSAGVNPYLDFAADIGTSSDKYGRPNTDRSWRKVLSERFPQANLFTKFKARNNKDSKRWFAESEASKIKQGYDTTKPNYDPSMDNNQAFKNQLKSFVGIPRVTTFSPKEFETKKRLTAFNKEFFATDWEAKEKVSYNDAQAQKEKLAGKYGFNLKKDIYGNYWKKYDTETTANTKRLKEEAARFNSPDTGFWHDYFSIPAGDKTGSSKRRPYLISKFEEWKRDHTFSKNPYYKLPKNGGINPFTLKAQEAGSQTRRAEGLAKYQQYLDYKEAKRTGDWSNWRSKYGDSGKSGGISYAGKFFKSTASRDRYIEAVTRHSKYTFDGKYFKSANSRDRFIAGNQKHASATSNQQPTTGRLWAEYFKLSSVADKQAFLKVHPELKSFDQPTNQAGWDALRATLRKRARDRADSLPNFIPTRTRILEGITARVAQGYKHYSNKAPVRWK